MQKILDFLESTCYNSKYKENMLLIQCYVKQLRTNERSNQNMITEKFFNENLDDNTKNIIINASFKELINPGMVVPGGLISYRNREKTAIVKIKVGKGEGKVTQNSDFATLDQLYSELSEALRLHGKAYFPLHSRFRISTLKGCNTITLVSEGKAVLELTLTMNPFKGAYLQMDPSKIVLVDEFTPLTPEEINFIATVQPWTKHNADLAFRGDCSWTRFEYITRDCIPLESRVVVSNGKLVSDVIMSRVNLTVAI